MDIPKPAPGRPAGKAFPAARTVLLAREDDDSLNNLARLWGCSAAAAVRRLIREKAEQLGVAPTNGGPRNPSPRVGETPPAPADRARRRVSGEELRRAAEAMRDYYTTAPEAVEWANFAGDTVDE